MYLVLLDGIQDWADVSQALAIIAEQDPSARFSLLVPTPCGQNTTSLERRLQAARLADSALEALRVKRLRVVDAVVGDPLPRKAIRDELSRREGCYSRLLLFTGPRGAAGIPANIAEQLQRLHQIPVKHYALGACCEPATARDPPLERSPTECSLLLGLWS